MKNNKSTPQALQIPCVINKIATLATGGWNVTIHVPEVAAMQVKALVGTENQKSFIMVLVEEDKIENKQVSKTCKKVTKRTIRQP